MAGDGRRGFMFKLMGYESTVLEEEDILMSLGASICMTLMLF